MRPHQSATPRVPRRRRGSILRVVAGVVGALAFAVAGAVTVAPGGAAAATAAHAPVASRLAAAATTVPAACRAAVTVVGPDTELAVGVLQGASAKLYSTGRRLGYTPRAIAYAGSSANRGVTIDRFFATDRQGRLHRLTVTERPSGASFAVTLDDAIIGRGWTGVRGLVASGPYLYGLTTDGGLKRYTVTRSYGVLGAGTVATRGWGSVRSLAYGGWWDLGSGKVAEDLVGLSADGTVRAYVVPRWAPARVSSKRLTSGAGWEAFAHVGVGECTDSRSRPVIAVTPAGDVHSYLDVDGNDQSWRDLRTGARVARGWLGLVAD